MSSIIRFSKSYRAVESSGVFLAGVTRPSNSTPMQRYWFMALSPH